MKRIIHVWMYIDIFIFRDKCLCGKMKKVFARLIHLGTNSHFSNIHLVVNILSLSSTTTCTFSMNIHHCILMNKTTVCFIHYFIPNTLWILRYCVRDALVVDWLIVACLRPVWKWHVRTIVIWVQRRSSLQFSLDSILL